jgi:DNA excision repair protein ERCC-3
MPPKRKAAAAAGRATKRVASGVSTPVSIDESEDDYSMGSESDPEGRTAPQKYDSQWCTVSASILRRMD